MCALYGLLLNFNYYFIFLKKICNLKVKILVFVRVCKTHLKFRGKSQCCCEKISTVVIDSSKDIERLETDEIA